MAERDKGKCAPNGIRISIENRPADCSKMRRMDPEPTSLKQQDARVFIRRSQVPEGCKAKPLPHVIATKMYRKNFPRLRLPMYRALNVDMGKFCCPEALPFGDVGIMLWVAARTLPQLYPC